MKPPETTPYRTAQQIVEDGLRAEIERLVASFDQKARENFPRFLPPGKMLQDLPEAKLRDLYGLCERSRIAFAKEGRL